MELQRFEVAAHLLANAIVRSPRRAKTGLWRSPRFPQGISLETISSFSHRKFASLCRLFPWEGIASSVEHGLFGTSVGRDRRGALCVQVYANARGSRYLSTEVLPTFQSMIEVPVSVVESGPISFARSRPFGGGASIGALGGSQTGTLGAWLKRNPSGNVVGISNNHVIADFNRYDQGDSVIQPGAGDGGTVNDVVGQIDGVVKLMEDDGTNGTVNLADVAWFSSSSVIPVDHSIGSSGRLPKGEEDLIQKFSNQTGPIAVWLCGRSSGTVKGSMTAIRASLFMTEGGKDYYFEDQIEITMSSLAHGDSGSLLLTDPDDKIAGLFFAIDSWPTGRGFASPWQGVKHATGLDFSYT